MQGMRTLNLSNLTVPTPNTMALVEWEADISGREKQDMMARKRGSNSTRTAPLFRTLLRFITVCYNHCFSRARTLFRYLPIGKLCSSPYALIFPAEMKILLLFTFLSFNKHVLTSYYVPGIVTGAGVQR